MVQRWPADAYLSFFLMKLTFNPTYNTLKYAPSFPMQLHISLYLSPRLSCLCWFYFASPWTEKRRRFFSWETLGEVCCSARAESRFSGSSLTPCSAIPSRTLCHGRHRVRTRTGVRKLSSVLAQPDCGVLVLHATYPLLPSESLFIFCPFLTSLCF